MAAPTPNPPTFTGEHERLLDPVLRVILPKGWRGPTTKELYLIVSSANPYIKALPRAEYDRSVAEIMAETTRDVRADYLRELGSSFLHVTLDSAWRFTLPAKFCAQIGIGADRPEITLVGAVSALEIWQPKGFRAWQKKKPTPGVNGEPRKDVRTFLSI